MKCLISEAEEKAWKVFMVRAFAFVFVALFVVVGINGALEPVHKAAVSKKLVLSKVNHAATSKELLNSTTVVKVKEDYGEGEGGGDDSNNPDGSMNRVGMDGQCSKENILVYQGATSPMPNGIPTYTVEIENVCLSGGCSISDIHMSCGWFSSARLVNPRVFHRIGYDDCLVNNGEPLNPGDALSFEYANSFKYPLSVSSVSC